MATKSSTPKGKTSAVTWHDLAGQTTHTVASVVWGWRIEITLLLAGVLAWAFLTDVAGLWPTVAVLVVAAGVVFGLPASRRFVLARVWCLVTRHRLAMTFHEIRAVTRFDRRPPAILRVRPTPVGERAVLWCRPGVSVADFESNIEELRAACWARDVRVARNARWSQVVTVHVVRRDPLSERSAVVPAVLTHLRGQRPEREEHVEREEVDSHG